jgi:hypothetical protein
LRLSLSVFVHSNARNRNQKINGLAARQSKDAVQEKKKREANGAKRGLAFQVFQ